MSEAEALLALYGAIDRAVVAGEADVVSLGELLAPYRQGAAGWYDGQYLPWLEQAKERAVFRARSERPERKERPEPKERRDREAYETQVSPADAGEVEYTAEAPPPPPPAPPLQRPVQSLRAEHPPISPRAQDVADALAAFEPRTLEGRAGARRLLAVTAAARALPRHFGPRGTHADVANAPLQFLHPGLDDDAPRRAERLHRRFATEFRSMPAWRTVVEESIAEGSLPRSFESQADAPPCTGRLVMRPDPGSTDSDPCTVLEAEFVTGDLTFEQAKNYLEPSNWVFPGSLWCRMEQDGSLGPNSFLYHETVSTCGCPPAPGGWTVSADLQFWFSHPTPYEARVEYDFPPGLPVAGSDIEIDEGSLRVIELDDGKVNVKTTKRVRFAGSFDGAGLSMFMCATGYTSALEDMVFSVTGDPLKVTKPFPIPAPTAGPQGVTMSPPPDPKKTNKAAAGDVDADETLDDIAADAAKHFEAYLKDSAASCTSSMQKIQAGTYKVEDAWADGIKMWTTYMSGLGKALDLGTRTAKTLAKDQEGSKLSPDEN